MSVLNFLVSIMGNFVGSGFFMSFAPFACAFIVLFGFITVIRYIVSLHK